MQGSLGGKGNIPELDLGYRRKESVILPHPQIQPLSQSLFHAFTSVSFVIL